MGGESLSKGGCKYAAAVLAPNGRIYGLPCSARRVLEVHPDAGDAREFGPDLGPGFKYQAAAASSASFGGRVYGIPFDAPRVLEVDPATSGVHEIGPELPGKGTATRLVSSMRRDVYCTRCRTTIHAFCRWS